jgi:hypothetical protein
MNNPNRRRFSLADADVVVGSWLQHQKEKEMGINLKTGERTEATLEEDQAADDERAADLRELDRMDREREGIPHYEVRATCAGCGTELLIEVPQPYCDDCK